MSKLKYVGLDMFAKGVIALIANGYKVDIKTLQKKAEDNTLYTYIGEMCDEILLYKHTQYNVEELNKFFQDYSNWFDMYLAERKLGIKNEQDGLLVVVSLILDTMCLPKDN